MKAIYVIETGKELIEAARRSPCLGDQSPCLPSDAVLILEDELQSVRLKAEGFVLGCNLKAEDIYVALIEAAGMKARVE